MLVLIQYCETVSSRAGSLSQHLTFTAKSNAVLMTFWSDGNGPSLVSALMQKPLPTCGNGALEMWLVHLKIEFLILFNFN